MLTRLIELALTISAALDESVSWSLLILNDFKMSIGRQ